MPRRIYTYEEGLNWDFWNLLTTIGAFVIGVAFVFFIINIFLSHRRGEQAPDDPWDGATLEWSISSPPPVYNFAEVPRVRSNIPLWTEKYPEVYGGEEEYEGEEHAAGHDEHEDHIHLPNPSYWPILVALGILLGFAGFIFTWAISIVGAVLLFVAVYGWALEPAFGEPDHV